MSGPLQGERPARWQVRQALPSDGPALIELMRSNPIEMESAYVVDRSPDFFALHRGFPGSIVLVAERPGAGSPDACASLFRYAGRMGETTRPYLLLTDLCRAPGGSHQAVRALVLAIVRAYHGSEAQGLLCLVNERNGPARRMAESPRARLPLRCLAPFDYVEVMPLTRHRVPGRYRIRRAESRQDLERGLAFLEGAHGRHRLWDPLTLEVIDRRGAALPGFSARNLVLQEQAGSLVGALIDYDPSPLVHLRILRYDWQAAMASRVLRALSGWTAQRTGPPAQGEVLRSRHVQAWAAEPQAGRHLFGWLGNSVLADGVHTYAALVDQRTPVPAPHWLRFAYPSRLYGAFKPGAGVASDVAPDELVYFNITLG